MYFRIKKLEQAWNRLFIRALGRLMPSGPPEKPDWDARPYRVLYLRYDKIGDMILSTSLIEAIARSHPTITLDVLASPANAPVLRGNPHVSRIVIWDKGKPARYRKLFKELRAARYDAVIDCMVLAPSTTAMLLMLATGARNRIGIGGRINDYSLTVRVPPATSAVHYIERAAVLATPFGVDIESVDWRPRLYFSDSEIANAETTWNESATRRLLVNISTGAGRKVWPDVHFVETLNSVRESEPRVDVVIIGTPDDSVRARAIATASGARYVATSTLRDAFALVRTADVVFTPDTSITHVASACGTPAVVLLAKSKAELWTAYGISGRNVVSDDDTVSSIPVARAIAALEEVLNEARRLRPR